MARLLFGMGKGSAARTEGRSRSIFNRPIRIDRLTSRHGRQSAAYEQWYGGRSGVSSRDLRLLGDSCGHPELSRRDADEALEVLTEHALAREAGVRGDLRQGEVAALQKLLRPLDATQDHVLVRRQPGGPLELPREVVDA